MFEPQRFSQVVSGLAEADDAAVYRLDEQHSLVVTLDFFPPVVDDPYDYGAIAAANSMSDVYAMGGRMLFALNVAALPPQVSDEVKVAILKGAADKVLEAGAAIAGGHTMDDKEPKFGLVAVGMLDGPPLPKNGAKVGDRLILTKPLGVGVLTTALKRGKLQQAEIGEAVASMKKLNRIASEAAVAVGAHGATDITGFGLIGHAHEMASSSHVRFRFYYDTLPLLPGAARWAADWTFPGGATTNKMYYERYISFAPTIEEHEQMLLYDPETSGGLLIAVSEDSVDRLQQKIKSQGEESWVIGEVVAGEGIEVRKTA